MNKTKKIIFMSIIFLMLILLLGFFYLKHVLNSSVAKDMGTVKVAGIQKQAFIKRDKNGIPFIEASNEQDLAYAVGYYMASERL